MNTRFHLKPHFDLEFQKILSTLKIYFPSCRSKLISQGKNKNTSHNKVYQCVTGSHNPNHNTRATLPFTEYYSY